MFRGKGSFTHALFLPSPSLPLSPVARGQGFLFPEKLRRPSGRCVNVIFEVMIRSVGFAS